MLVAALAVLLAPGAASAHAVLERTTPADGAVIASSPPRVMLSFGENVTLVPSAVRVYDAALHRVDNQAAEHVDGDPRTVGVGLRPNLPAGTYSVTWRVVSADSHPVQGGFRFSVGHPGPVGAAPETSAGPGGGVGTLLALARFAEYAGLAALGGALTLAWLLGAGCPDRRRARRPVVAGWWLLLGGTVAAVLLQGPDAQGLGALSALDPTVFAVTAASPAGVLGLVRVGLLIPLAVAGQRLLTSKPDHTPRVPLAAAVGSGLGVVVTFSLGGHAGVGSPAALGVVVDAAHAAAMALWTGGLAVLGAVLAPQRITPPSAGAVTAVLPRFSRLAQPAVGVIVVTGLYQTWRHVGVPGALVATTYGWLLVAKIAVVVMLLVLGNRARVGVARWAPRPNPAPQPASSSRPRAFALSLHPARGAAGPPGRTAGGTSTTQPDPPAVATLRRGLLAETGLAVIVLAVTSVLVATPQAAQSYAPPVTLTQVADGLALTARVDGAHTGATTLHLSGTDRAGHPLPLTLLEATATLPAQGIGPLPLPTTSPAAVPVSFAVPGAWALDVTVATSATAPTVFRVEVPVR